MLELRARPAGLVPHTGMVEIDGRPINVARPDGSYDAGHGWLGAAEMLTLKLGELRRQSAARRE